MKIFKLFLLILGLSGLTNAQAYPADNDELIIFVVRNQYAKDHHNTATLFQYGEINELSFEPGAALRVLNMANGKERDIFSTLSGVIRDPEVSWDGKRILFSYRKDKADDYHIYEINADGTNLKQLTFAKGVSDIDPMYLPNNQIIFSSTREPKYCMCNRHIMANLYRMNPDGSNIVQLGKSTLFEGHPALMADGRVIYDRWEYVDRNFGDAQGLWTMNPDGTKHAIYYGNNTASPGGIIDPRPIPNSKLILCIFGSCHDRPWGALTLLDRSRGVDGAESVIKIWPPEAQNIIGKGNWDAFMPLKVRYEDPYPLTPELFIFSKSLFLDQSKGNAPINEKMGLFIMDIQGQEVHIYEGDSLSCFDPMPLKPRKKPREIPENRKFDSSPGFFYVQNVYEGTHMDGVSEGSVKYLRVIESPEKRTYTSGFWGGQGQQAPGVNWHSFETKRILGLVPVEPDGSVNFESPSGKHLYFQLLDENKKMIQSMRSGVMVHPGETNGCIGCHEDRLSAPPQMKGLPSALQKQAQLLSLPEEKPHTFSFTGKVQPIFDRHCVSCHDFNKKAGKKLILAGDLNPYFNASYIDLHVKKQVNCIGGGPAEIQQAYSWGSNSSKLITVLEMGHQGISLSREEMEILYTWIDLNGVYYAEYESAYPDNPAGRSPLTNSQLKRLGNLCGVDFKKMNSFNRTEGPQITFERPELSPCLAKLKTDSPKYTEALDIIESGRDQLAMLPRADMEGFVPCEEHRTQLEKYAVPLSIEEENNRAVSEGRILTDSPH